MFTRTALGLSENSKTDHTIKYTQIKLFDLDE